MPRIVADTGKMQYERHGLSASPEYGIWRSMISRCHNPNVESYATYGQKGIAVCERWLNSFMAFYQDVGPRPSSEYTLDRLNNDLGYQPGNVAWRTYLEQNNNKTNNRRLEVDGEALTLQQVSTKTGIKRETIAVRLEAGMSVEEAITKPLRGKEKYSYNGRSLTIDEISQETGVKSKTIRMRMSRGMDITAAASGQSYKQPSKSIAWST